MQLLHDVYSLDFGYLADAGIFLITLNYLINTVRSKRNEE